MVCEAVRRTEQSEKSVLICGSPLGVLGTLSVGALLAASAS